MNIGQHQDAARIPGAGSGIEVELQARFQDGIGAVKSERQAKAAFSRLQDDVTPHRVQVAMNARDGDLKTRLLLGGTPHHIDACRRLGVRIGRQGGFEFQERIFQHLDIAIDKEGERPAGPDLVNVCVPRVGFVAERNVPHTDRRGRRWIGWRNQGLAKLGGQRGIAVNDDVDDRGTLATRQLAGCDDLLKVRDRFARREHRDRPVRCSRVCHVLPPDAEHGSAAPHRQVWKFAGPAQTASSTRNEPRTTEGGSRQRYGSWARGTWRWLSRSVARSS